MGPIFIEARSGGADFAIQEDWMMKKLVCLGTALLMGLGVAGAARQMEWLNRGLVAVKTSGGVYVSHFFSGLFQQKIAIFILLFFA